MDQDRIKKAFANFRAGQNSEAAQACREILAVDPDHAEINQLLSVIYSAEGRLVEAMALLERAVATPNATAEMHGNFGAALFQVGRANDAIAAYNRALALDPNYAEAFNNLGIAYRHVKKLPEAIMAFKKAIELRPQMLQAQTNLRTVYRDLVPSWHFAMMNDEPRNSTYDAAIRRAVAGKRVLEIGTGAGLLAMMAARAGAKTVTTCDRVRLIADRAREIIAQNGLAGQVNVVGKGSTELVMGGDLAERAEVLIAEIFGRSLIDEGVLPTLEHAHKHLLTEDAIVVPAGGSVMGYLAGGEALKKRLFVETVDGFDLSSFNDFGPPVYTVASDNLRHEVLSDETELLHFDFRKKSFPAQADAEWLLATKPGVCVGIVQWIRIDLDAEIRYENRPAFNDNKMHWGYAVHRFPRPIQVQPGDEIPIVIRHDRRHLHIELAE